MNTIQVNKSITKLSLSPNGSQVVTATEDFTLTIWNSRMKHEQIFKLEGHRNSITCCTFSHDSKYLASGSKDSTIIIWNTEIGQLVVQLTLQKAEIRALAYSPDGKWLASADATRHISLYLEKFSEDFKALDADINSIAFSYDSKRLVVGGGTLSEGAKLQVFELDDHSQLWKLKYILQGHISIIYQCIFSPSGQVISLAYDSNDRVLKRWTLPLKTTSTPIVVKECETYYLGDSIFLAHVFIQEPNSLVVITSDFHNRINYLELEDKIVTFSYETQSTL